MIAGGGSPGMTRRVAGHHPASIRRVTAASSAVNRTLSVCVYCSSSEGVSDGLRAVADAVGAGLARRGWSLVYGGGSVGLMGVVSAAKNRIWKCGAGASDASIHSRVWMTRCELGASRFLSAVRATAAM